MPLFYQARTHFQKKLGGEKKEKNAKGSHKNKICLFLFQKKLGGEKKEKNAKAKF